MSVGTVREQVGKAEENGAAIGGESVTVDDTTAGGLTPTAGAKSALVTCLDVKVRWRSDAAPTTTVGHVLDVDGLLFVGSQELSQIKFISTDAAGSNLLVTYYGIA